MSLPVRLVVRLTPRAASDRIDGWTTDPHGRPALQVRVSAPPTDGRANDALQRLVAAALQIAPSKVRLAAGAGARIKVLEIEAADEAQVRLRLGGLEPSA